MSTRSVSSTSAELSAVVHWLCWLSLVLCQMSHCGSSIIRQLSPQRNQPTARQCRWLLLAYACLGCHILKIRFLHVSFLCQVVELSLYVSYVPHNVICRSWDEIHAENGCFSWPCISVYVRMSMSLWAVYAKRFNFNLIYTREHF